MKMLLIKSSRRGSVLTLILLVVVMLLVMGAGLLSLGMHTRLFATRTSSEIAARCAADAGLTRAVAEMNQKLQVKPWDDTNLPQATDEPLPNCNAIFSYTVTEDYTDNYIIESVGKSGPSERTVSCSLPLQGPFEYAIFADELITLKSGTSIDWYNYDADEGNLQVGTNSILPDTIVLDISATINGDVVVGAGGDPDGVVIKNDCGGIITGSTYPLTESRSLPPVTVPEELTLLPSGGTITGDKTLVTSAKYDSIKLGSNRVITIDGPVELYIIGGIELKNGSELRIVDEFTNPDASLVLYLGGNMETKNDSAINNYSMVPANLKIYGLDGCQTIDFLNSGMFYGAIYSPNADVTMHSAVDVYGSIAAKSLVQYSSANVYYDASLRNVSIDDALVRFVVDQWWEH